MAWPLPKGKIKIYRRDVDARNEFIGEDEIDHTPKDETVRLYTGNAFDIVGERLQTDFRIDTSRDFVDESFEIKVRNHKDEAVEVRIVEHMYRSLQWEITATSMENTKKDARTIEFRPTVAPGGEAVIRLYSSLHLVRGGSRVRYRKVVVSLPPLPLLPPRWLWAFALHGRRLLGQEIRHQHRRGCARGRQFRLRN